MRLIEKYFEKKEKERKKERLREIIFWLLEGGFKVLVFFFLIFFLVSTITYSFLYTMDWFKDDNSRLFNYFCNLEKYE